MCHPPGVLRSSGPQVVRAYASQVGESFGKCGPAHGRIAKPQGCTPIVGTEKIAPAYPRATLAHRWNSYPLPGSISSSNGPGEQGPICAQPRGGRLLAFRRDPPPVEVGRRPPRGGGGGGGGGIGGGVQGGAMGGGGGWEGWRGGVQVGQFGVVGWGGGGGGGGIIALHFGPQHSL